MEVYEMPITVEESRNYHKLLYQLKALNLVEWIKTYIFTAVSYTHLTLPTIA